MFYRKVTIRNVRSLRNKNSVNFQINTVHIPDNSCIIKNIKFIKNNYYNIVIDSDKPVRIQLINPITKKWIHPITKKWIHVKDKGLIFIEHNIMSIFITFEGPIIIKNIMIMKCGPLLNFKINKSKLTVFYLISKSINQALCGYTIRTHQIVQHLAKYVNIICITKPEICNVAKPKICNVAKPKICNVAKPKICNVAKPEICNVAKPEICNVTHIKHQIIDGILYINTYMDKSVLLNNRIQINNIYTKEYIDAYVGILDSLIKNITPNIIHACSDYVNPLVANILNHKCIYEIRGLWYLSRLSYDPDWINSDSCKEYIKNEQNVFKKNTLITITRQLQKEIGCTSTLIPNCIDLFEWSESLNNIGPESSSVQLKQQYNPDENIIVGYVGTLTRYEGLDLLVQAFNKINKIRNNIKLFFIGKGSTIQCRKVFKELQVMSKNNSNIVFFGEINYKEIKKYYSLIDIVCLPRKSFKVCEIVSPLKPFEVMALKKPLIVSNVEPLKDIITDGENGLVHEKDNYKSLANKLLYLVDNKEERIRLGESGYQWVLKNRQWKHYIPEIVKLYTIHKLC